MNARGMKCALRGSMETDDTAAPTPEDYDLRVFGESTGRKN